MPNDPLLDELLRRELENPATMRSHAPTPPGTIRAATGRERIFPTPGEIQNTQPIIRILQALGLDNPLETIDGAGPAQAVTQFVTKGVPNVALRQLGTADFVKRLKRLLPKQEHPSIEDLAERYPRITAHMAVESFPSATKGNTGGRSLAKTSWQEKDRATTRAGMMRGTDAGKTRIPVKFDPEFADPTTVAHEMTHVAQALSRPKDIHDLYALSAEVLYNAQKKMGNSEREALRSAYQGIPFERTARMSEWRTFTDTDVRRAGGPPENAMNTLRELANQAARHEKDKRLRDLLTKPKRR